MLDFFNSHIEMTRYTSFGRKRTYLEAGFGEKQRTADDVENEPVPTDRVNQPSPAKKRKRTKHKGPKTDEASVQNGESENGDTHTGEREQRNGFISKKKAPQKKDHPRKGWFIIQLFLFLLLAKMFDLLLFQTNLRSEE